MYKQLKKWLYQLFATNMIFALPLSVCD